MPDRISYRLSFRLAVPAPVASLVVFVCRWIVLHRSDHYFALEITNLFVGLLPFAFSIFSAFIPDMRNRHIALRIGVVVVGLIFSCLLWENQRLAIEASNSDQVAAVTQAVSDANAHSDQKISSLSNKLDDVNSALSNRLNSVAGQVDNQVSKSETTITTDIGKVVVPPQKFPDLQFGLANSTGTGLIASEEVDPDASGSYPVNFMVTNISDTAAQAVDIWIILCDQCTYASEPEGFDKPTGMAPQIRHKLFGDLNPGVSMATMTVHVKTNQPFQNMVMGLKYSCKNCGALKPIQTVTVLTPNPLPLFPQATSH